MIGIQGCSGIISPSSDVLYSTCYHILIFFYELGMIFFFMKELRGSLYENDRKFQLAAQEGSLTAQVSILDCFFFIN